MYNSLGSKLDTLSGPDLMEELGKLAVVQRLAEEQDVEAVVCVNNPAMVYMENTAKPKSHRSPAQGSLTQRSPAHSSTKVHRQSFHEGNANDKVLVRQVQEDLAAEDQPLATEVRQVVPAEEQFLAAEDQALATEVQPVVAAEDQILAAEDQVLGRAVQLVVAAEDHAEQDEDRCVHPSKQEEGQTVHAESTAGITIAQKGGISSWPAERDQPSLTQKKMR